MLERSAHRSHVRLNYLSASLKDVLARHESLKPDRSTCMDLGSADSDFRTKTESVAIGESGTAVGKHICTVHLCQELSYSQLILSDDGIGVVRGVMGNEVNR